ncbi:MAG: Uma2 family endonuclease [Cyanobacteriota bacterium]|nr:Uma2 family endonuclease [Cyanobacteriota bacterium]
MTAYTAQELEAQMPDGRRLLSDEPEMESSLHYMQLLLLVTSLEWAWRERQDFFIGANLTVYFSRQQLKHRDFRGPDFFLVKNTTREPRSSWVVWEEDGRYPDLIIELLSDSTATVDRTTKRQLYAERFHTPEYFYFSPETLEFQGFRLNFNHYEPIAANHRGWLWSETLGLFLGIEAGQLRYFSLEGMLVPTPEEAARAEIARAAQESQRAEQESQRADRLAAQLRALGVEPEEGSEGRKKNEKRKTKKEKRIGNRE